MTRTKKVAYENLKTHSDVELKQLQGAVESALFNSKMQKLKVTSQEYNEWLIGQYIGDNPDSLQFHRDLPLEAWPSASEKWPSLGWQKSYTDLCFSRFDKKLYAKKGNRLYYFTHAQWKKVSIFKK